jgi:hypothetical protein
MKHGFLLIVRDRSNAGFQAYVPWCPAGVTRTSLGICSTDCDKA